MQAVAEGVLKLGPYDPSVAMTLQVSLVGKMSGEFIMNTSGGAVMYITKVLE